eukprot:gnl/MRDRNA2_/MRDRNA2_65134_c0_seq1.p1 gnl/MRDRNA2_/MRDRNA2_65134_c0~~gnl/MRDRNA2_/MRDRNA2_65134_c0_seq1.p1  ORF type:complete len:156 (-),score=15.58 gnl/MRDRNA2_/MRDRNA2_65134_c0_seq1:77-544(-)
MEDQSVIESRLCASFVIAGILASALWALGQPLKLIAIAAAAWLLFTVPAVLNCRSNLLSLRGLRLAHTGVVTLIVLSSPQYPPLMYLVLLAFLALVLLIETEGCGKFCKRTRLERFEAWGWYSASLGWLGVAVLLIGHSAGKGPLQTEDQAYNAA